MPLTQRSPSHNLGRGIIDISSLLKAKGSEFMIDFYDGIDIGSKCVLREYRVWKPREMQSWSLYLQ